TRSAGGQRPPAWRLLSETDDASWSYFIPLSQPDDRAGIRQTRSAPSTAATSGGLATARTTTSCDGSPTRPKATGWTTRPWFGTRCAGKSRSSKSRCIRSGSPRWPTPGLPLAHASRVTPEVTSTAWDASDDLEPGDFLSELTAIFLRGRVGEFRTVCLT